jgi:predicted  nucleic acid-binding Zn-ribbon protein
MPGVAALHRLQEIELRLEAVEARLAAIQKTLDDDSSVVELKQHLEQSEGAMKDARMANSRADHDVQSVREKLTRTNKKLYSGAIKNPKELQDLQLEAQSLTKHLGKLEDELLDAMVTLEEVQEVYEDREQRLEQAIAARAAENSDLLEEKSTLVERRERLRDEWGVTREALPAEDLEFYDRVKRSTGGIVISRLEEGSCSACGLSIPPSKQQKIRNQREYIRCSQCGRILYDAG